jgi:hypothetical protein
VRPSIRAHIATCTEDISCACNPQMEATTSSMVFLGVRRCRWWRRVRNAITRAQSIRGTGGFIVAEPPLNGADLADFQCDQAEKESLRCQLAGAISGADRSDELQISETGRPALEAAQARRA